MSSTTWLGSLSSTDYATAGNWSNAVPITSSVVLFTLNALGGVDTGLDQSAVAITSFTQDLGFNQFIGGATTYLQLYCPTSILGAPSPNGQGNGSGRVNIDYGSFASVCTVLASAGSATDANQSPVRLLGSSLTLNAFGGIIGVGQKASETATLTALNVDGGTVTLGVGVTTTALNLYAGNVVNNTTITLPVENIYGSYTCNGTATHTALTILNTRSSRGYAILNAPCTITALVLGGTLDLSQGAGAVTVTNCTRYPGGRIIDPNGRAVFSNFVQDAQGANLSDAIQNFGTNRTWKIV